MTWRRIPPALALLVLPAASLRAQGAACDTGGTLWRQLSRCAAAVLPARDTIGLSEALEEAYKKLRDPSTLNHGLGWIESRSPRRNLIGALRLQFLNVQHEGDNRLGLAYDWRRDVVRTPHRQGTFHRGLRSGLEARGTLMTNAGENLDEFIEFSLHGTYFITGGGSVAPEALAAHLRAIGDSLELLEPDAPSRVPVRMYRLLDPVWDSLSTQFYVTVGPVMHFETNQAGDQDQFAAGARIGFDIKAWKPGARLARFNAFDWPAAAIRYLSGTDSVFRPSGAAMPTVTVAYHWVAPGANPARETADAGEGLDSYGRFAFQVKYRSRLTELPEGSVWLDVVLDHKSESAPSDAIAEADLHRFTRLQLTVETPAGMTVSWTTGRHPLTGPTSDRWGLGFRFGFR